MANLGRGETKSDVVAHYQRLRRFAYDKTEQEFAPLHVKLSEISYGDAVEADAWRSQWVDPERAPSWSWVQMYQEYRSNAGIKRFDPAIRVGGKLCGLCYGVPNRSRLILKLHAITRAPVDNPLRRSCFRVALFGASTYADAIGSEEIWLVQPMNEAVAAYYAGFGFTSERNATGKITHMRIAL
jgi:hypothetical protein